MESVLCKDQVIRFRQKIGQMAYALVVWLAELAGVALLPPGCRAIPAGHFSFDPEIVKLFGGTKARDSIAKAIIYQKIQGWIESNRSHGRNQRDGETWSYNTYEKWAAIIPLFHQKTIEKHIRDMEAMGVLASREFNRRKGNRTKWYTSPLRLFDGLDVALLWSERETPTIGVKDSVDSSMNYGAIHEPSMPKIQTPPPAYARAREEGAGGVQSRMQPVSIESVLDRPAVLEAAEEADEHEAYSRLPGTPDNASVMPIPLVPLVPLPTGDEPTDEDAETETETVSSGDTQPVDVPEWASQINLPRAEREQMFAQHGVDLIGWYEYGRTRKRIEDPVAFALAKIKQGLKPPVMKPKSDYTDGQSYITGEFADFVQH